MLIYFIKNMGRSIKAKNSTEVVKSIYDYRMQRRMKLLETKVNKIYKFGLTFWAIIAVIVLFFILMMMS